jgi:hypothetical protein
MSNTFFPNECIKGIPNQNFWDREGVVYSSLFEFKENPIRSDSRLENSVNWIDCEDCIGFTMSQKKEDGAIQFREGLAVLSRDRIDSICTMPAVNNLLSYERAPLNGNPYHGNLLLDTNAKKHIRRHIQAALALAVNRIIPSEQNV